MTFEQLEYFIAVVKNQTFFDASEKLNISQSSLSKNIKKLESELGCQLLDRTQRKARLTDAGSFFYYKAVKLVDEYHETLANMEVYSHKYKETIRICMLPISSQYHLTLPLIKFRKKYPDVNIQLKEMEASDLLSEWRKGHFDFAIIRENMLDKTKNSSYVLANDELTLVVPRNHHLIKRDENFNILPVKTEVLENKRIILMNPETAIYGICRECFLKAGIHPHILRTARIESIIGAVAAGEGVSLLAQNHLNVFRCDDVISIPLKPAVPVPIIIAMRKDHFYGTISRELLHYLTGE